MQKKVESKKKIREMKVSEKNTIYLHHHSVTHKDTID